uniref:Uncharacterized protein n=1 Tax=Diddensiella santjacobensis TaxID=2704139 RepID=S5U4V9_9ASCO|nr:hypothetical protein [Diddensiella santjacobensis]AGS44136.1 hypothetical protein [Diddensiella santjacobensis]
MTYICNTVKYVTLYSIVCNTIVVYSMATYYIVIYVTYINMVHIWYIYTTYRKVQKLWKFSGFRHFYIVNMTLLVWGFRDVKVAFTNIKILKILEIFEISTYKMLTFFSIYHYNI